VLGVATLLARSVGTGAAAPDRLGQMTEYEAIEVGD
jgi:hypothetical protein